MGSNNCELGFREAMVRKMIGPPSRLIVHPRLLCKLYFALDRRCRRHGVPDDEIPAQGGHQR